MTGHPAALRASISVLLLAVLTACAGPAPGSGAGRGAGDGPATASASPTTPASGLAPAPPTLQAAPPEVLASARATRLVTMPRPPILAAEDRAGIALARLNAERTRWGELYGRSDAEPVSADTLPFLTATPEGRRFLAATGPRAIARGLPEESCPATVTAAPARQIALPALVEQVLGQCIAALAPSHPGCGCRVLAVGDRVTVPRAEMNYATGTTARMRIPELGIDQVLVAEDAADAVLLRDLLGPLARVERLPDGVRVRFLREDRAFAGRSLPVGYRRGRIAERIYATDATGATLRLLIGFSPDELAEGAAAWLAWPG